MTLDNITNLPETSAIYKFTCLINNKVYIGKTSNLKIRIKNHINSKKSKQLIHRAIRKYKVENFDLELLIVGIIAEETLKDLEIDFIKLYNSNNIKFGYNLTIGGDGTSGYITSLSHRDKLRNSHLGKKLSEEHKLNISLSNKGKTHTIETRKKLSKARIGKPLPYPIWNKGKKLSEEHCRNLSIAHKDQRCSEERRQKLIGRPSPKKGVPMTEEQKIKISESKKGKPAWNKGIKSDIPSPKKGIPMSEDQKQKIRDTKRRKKDFLLYGDYSI